MGKLWFFVTARIYRKVQSFAANGGKQAEKPRDFPKKGRKTRDGRWIKKYVFFAFPRKIDAAAAEESGIFI